MSDVVKFTAFAVVAGLTAVGVGWVLTDTGQLGSVTAYHAEFRDVSNLTVGDEVRVAGIDVGQVEGLSIRDDSSVVVTFTVVRSFPLTSGTNAAVRYKNLIGDRFLELSRGTETTERMRPGDMIPVMRTAPALDLDALFNGFQPLLAALSPDRVNAVSGEIIAVLQGEAPTIDGLLATLASVTSTLADRDQVIGRVVDNLNAVLATVHQRDGELSQLITDLRRLVGGLDADRDQIGTTLEHVDEANATMARLLDEARPPLRADIDQLGRLATGLNANADSVSAMLAELPQAYKDMARAGSWGSFFNVYLCGLRIKLGDSLYTPTIRSGVPRCQPVK